MATRQREKAAKLEKERDKRPTAIARYVRIPSDKIKIVLDLIRGKSYEQAVSILTHTNKSASPIILKIVNSAAANAENNLNIAKDNLFVAQCWAMPGPTLKRMMPRARGRADRILKRTSHIRVILEEREVKKTATPKPMPKTDKERPLTITPNAKKPLGTKKEPAKTVKTSSTAKIVTSKGAKSQQTKKVVAPKNSAPKPKKEVK